MERLELDTQKSLYPAIEISIKGKDGKPTIYESHKLTHKFNQTILPIETKIQGGMDAQSFYDWVGLMYGVEKEVLENLAHMEVVEIYVYTSKAIRKSMQDRLGKEVDFFQAELTNAQIRAGIEPTFPPKKPKRTIPSPKNPKRSGGKD